jgi:hypothetical protein
VSANRPAVVTAAAALCLVFGFCCAGGGVMFPLAPSSLEQEAIKLRRQLEAQREALRAHRENATNPQQLRAIDEKLAELDNALELDAVAMLEKMIPGAVRNCMLFSGMAALILYGLMFLSGVGMISLMPWARKLALACAIGWICVAIVSAILQVTVVVPASEQGWAELGAEDPNLSAFNFPVIIALLLSCVWPGTLLGLLNTRAAREAFAPAEPPDLPKRVTLVPK